MTQLNPANLFQLQGRGIHVTYSATSFSGQPLFQYQDEHGTQNFHGDQINIVSTPIGSLVSVTIRRTVDSGSTSFSVVIPTVNVLGAGQASPVHTDGVTTVHRFNIVPMLNQGQMEIYRVTPLTGTATLIIA
jgi:hypothetical protein